MKGNALYIQSGGPTAVINSSAYGVICECLNQRGRIEKLYAAEHGILGVINGRLFALDEEDKTQFSLLKQTPSMMFGSCRHQVESEEDYRKILDTLRYFNIRYLFINGGNGSARAGCKLYEYLEKQNCDIKLIVIPKTVDNDISHIDHAPGFPSAARHVAITLSELAHDIQTYDTDLIMVAEVMGRNTGFLAASGLAACKTGYGPDLIYVPEVTFDEGRFVEDIRRVVEGKGKCLAVVPEGVKTTDGKYLFESTTLNKADNPAMNMGGITPYLGQLLRGNFTCKIRCIDLGLMQRCSSHTVSKIDIEEATGLGLAAVRAALDGESGKMVSLKRISDRPYQTNIELEELSEVAARDNTLPLRYVNEQQNFIKEEFLDYIEPLIGELPQYANFTKKIVQIRK